jgi:hypothetical protein
MTNKMKIIPFFPFLSVIALGIPAYAVDYVACREMLRTKNDFFSISKQYENGEIENIIEIDPKKIREKCDKYSDKMPIMEKIKHIRLLEITKNLPPMNLPKPLYTAYFDCISAEWDKQYNAVEKKGFRTFGGAKWYEKAKRVQVDMKKAGCPYE